MRLLTPDRYRRSRLRGSYLNHFASMRVALVIASVAGGLRWSKVREGSCFDQRSELQKTVGDLREEHFKKAGNLEQSPQSTYQTQQRASSLEAAGAQSSPV
jgi:hypothetical protein